MNGASIEAPLRKVSSHGSCASVQSFLLSAVGREYFADLLPLPAADAGASTSPSDSVPAITQFALAIVAEEPFPEGP